MTPLEIEILIGLGTGLVVGITGASGVLLVVPLLTILMGTSMHTAVGTSLFVDVITPLFVAYSYYRRGNVNLKAALWLAVGAIVGAQAGALFANLVVPSKRDEHRFHRLPVCHGALDVVQELTPRTGEQRRAPDGDEHAQPPDHFRHRPAARHQQRTVRRRRRTGVPAGAVDRAQVPHAAGGGHFLTDHGDDGCLRHPGLRAARQRGLVGGGIIAVAAVVSGLLSARLANKVSEKILNRIVGVIFAAIGVLMVFLR